MFYNKTLTKKMKRDTSFEEKKKSIFKIKSSSEEKKKYEEIIP